MSNGKVLAENIIYRALNVAIVFVINVLLSRLAGVAGYGLLSLMIANATIFNLLSTFGSDSSITFHTASGKIAPRKLIGFLLGIIFFQLASLGTVEAISWISTGHTWLFKSDEFASVWIGFVFLLSISLVEKYAALLNGNQLFSLCNRVLLYSNIILLVVFAGFYFSGTIDFFLLVQVYVLLNFLQAVFLMITYHHTANHKITVVIPARADWKMFFTYSLLVFAINLIQFLAYRIDYWLLDYYKGEQELGWYSLAVRLAQFFWVMPLLFASIIFPKVADNNRSFDDQMMLVLIRGMNWLNLIAGLVLFVTAGVFIPLLFGNEYANSILLFQLLLPGILLFCIATILAAWFAGHNKMKINLGGSLLCFVVILALDIWLIPGMGMKGAAIASSIGYAVTALYYMIVYCFLNKVPVRKLFIPEQNDSSYITGIFRFIFSKR